MNLKELSKTSVFAWKLVCLNTSVRHYLTSVRASRLVRNEKLSENGKKKIEQSTKICLLNNVPFPHGWYGSCDYELSQLDNLFQQRKLYWSLIRAELSNNSCLEVTK